MGGLDAEPVDADALRHPGGRGAIHLSTAEQRPTLARLGVPLGARRADAEDATCTHDEEGAVGLLVGAGTTDAPLGLIAGHLEVPRLSVSDLPTGPVAPATNGQ